tara:strand:+ start:40 stop:561 length:522 start_codon:yes stop_codon:yes gene_type:complete
MIKIIDNFLPEEEFLNIKDLIEGREFPWYFNRSKIHHGDGKFQHVHTFFKYEGVKNVNDTVKIELNSPYLEIWNNFMNKIEATRCYRVKANMTLKLSSQIADDSDWHVDSQGDALKTAVFYINTNDGYTELESGVRVGSIANRVCIFDSNLKHRGVGHTSPDHHRIVVNFNYA